MKRKKSLKEKGITLIALVITIIILLILAGIAISTLTGSELFEKARLAKEKQENAEIEEDEILGDYENKISNYVSGSRDTVTISKEEYEILKIFLMHPGMAYTRNQLLSEVWGIDSYGETRTVDMHIKTLRQKLGDGGRYITTVRNVGYKMEGYND